jgi:U4/U6.U5 tri-snRNP-associated protein 1
MSEEVLELSIAETNKLRETLGLAPLRLHSDIQQQQQQQQQPSTTAQISSDDSKEVLELSVGDTNDLRAKLGLAPLRTESARTNIVHKPAENDRDQQEATDRVQQAKLKRDVEKGGLKTFGSSTLADEKDGALSWAAKMRTNAKQTTTTKSKNKKTNEKNQSKMEGSERYGETDLDGINVSHNMSELEAGSTVVLTLADAPLLATADSSNKVVGLNEGEETLENVNLSERKMQQDGLKKKRQLELGMGRAGGYAGFDDDEFEELGGTQGPSRFQRGGDAGAAAMEEDEKGRKHGGFRIGQGIDDKVNPVMSDFDAIRHGKAISLEQTKADVAASDFMTVEEEQEEKEKRRKKKDGNFKKKKTKKDKKEKRRRRKVESDDEEEEKPPANDSLLEQLEKTAVVEAAGLRKRRRSDSLDEAKPEKSVSNPLEMQVDGDESTKRAKYDKIMAKGNERTNLAFADKQKQRTEEILEEEPDDSFLHAALAKARRLNRLREMSQKETKGADAVAKAVRLIKKENDANETDTPGTMTFAIDDTREFTRAIQARAQQKEREQQNTKPVGLVSTVVIKKEEDSATSKQENQSESIESVEVEDVDINELAKEVKADDTAAAGFDGTTADTVGVGRGLSSFVSMLRQTGEISGKQSKEELRGRAKDERNYEYYKPLDLKKVVKIGANATDKDKEFANREIKLEYRDKHGRLLTSKEAYRELCYQFHGHGASKKNEEKRLKQVAREQGEARMASQHVAAAREGTAAGTLGALKSTQKATGKAFVVHKT